MGPQQNFQRTLMIFWEKCALWSLTREGEEGGDVTAKKGQDGEEEAPAVVVLSFLVICFYRGELF